MSNEFSQEMENEIEARIKELRFIYDSTVEEINPNWTIEEFVTSLEARLKETKMKIARLQRGNSGGHLDDDNLRIHCIALIRLIKDLS